MRPTMKLSAHKTQHGAVLAFSLVMLLLLTLVSTSMIQQNKTQISLAANAGQQTKTFASVETALLQTQSELAQLRYTDGTGTIKNCKSGATNSIHPVPHSSGTVIDDGTILAKIQAEYCISNWNATTKLGDVYECVYTSSGVRNVGSVIVAENSAANPPVSQYPSEGSFQACKRLNWVGGTGANEACQIEVYTLDVTFTDSTTQAKRTVESKFEVDCSGNMPLTP
jgi:Tfp pilus assembly protein PilX